MEDRIRILKKFFTITNAAFEMQRTIILALGQNYMPSYMAELHKQALIELEKDTPNMEFIDGVLKEMEDAAKGTIYNTK